jgi:glucokinase
MTTAIGIDAGGTTTKGALVTREGTITDRVEIPTDPSAAGKTILDVVDRLMATAERSGTEPAAIGVGAAGFIEFASGEVTFSPNTSYGDPHIGAAVRARSALPVAVDNDANAAVWGERTFGAAKGADHVAMLVIGTGIGSGFVIDGSIVRGFTGAGAEFGHVVIDPGGPRCPCGLRGCLEQLASGTAIGRMGRRAAEDDPATRMVELAGSADEIAGEHVAAAAAEHDEAAMRVLRRAGRALAIGLSNLVNVFDPQVIVLGGSVIQAGEPYLGVARDELVKMTAAQRRRPVRMDVTALGNDAGILGAAALALDRSTREEPR